MNKEDISKEYKELLVLPGETHLKDSLVKEASLYLKKPAEEIKKVMEDSFSKTKEEWEKLDPKTEEEIADYYSNSELYLVNDLLAHHADYGWYDTYMACLSLAKKLGIKDYLDYGSGIGSLVILLAKNKINTTCADISSILLNFVKFRFNLRKLEGKFIDLKTDSPEKDSFDFITCIDVLEHIKDPEKEILKIKDLLRKGGYFYFHAAFGEEKEFPMHLHKGDVDIDLEKIGFEKIDTEFEKITLFKKL